MRTERFLDRVIALSLASVLLAAPGALARGKGGPWDEHIEAGRNALQMGDFQSADRYLKEAMTDTAKFKDDDVRLGSTFYEMGQLNIRIQNYTLAKEYYERALAVQQKLLGAESLEAADSLYGIALCHQQLGDQLAAEIFLKRVDEIWKKKLGPKDPKLISILPSMASYASMKSNLPAAEAYYRQLVDVAQAKGNQEELGTYLNLLATTLGNEGKFAEAKEYANRAVDILKKSSDSSIAIDSAKDNLDIIKKNLGESVKELPATGPSSSGTSEDQSRKIEEQNRLIAEAKKKAEAEKLAAQKAQEQAEALRKAAELAKKQEEQARIAAEKAQAAEQAKLAAEQAKAAEQARLAAEKARSAEQARIAAEKARKDAENQLAMQQQQQVRVEVNTNKQGNNDQKQASDSGSQPWHTDRAIKKPSSDSKQQQMGKVRYLAEGRLISGEEYKALLLANEAYEAMRQEKFRMAADILNKALEVYPELASAHTNLGLALSRLGQNDEAMEHLKIAISLDPSRSAPWVNLASSFQTSGRLKECVLTYKEYLRRFPDDALAVKAKDLVKHLQEEADEQDAVEKSVASAGGATDYFPFTTASGTIKWPDSRLPVKVHVASGSRVPGYRTEYQGIMNDSFKSWSQASQDKIKFDFVNKPEGADIECIWTNDYSQVSSPAEGGEAQVSWTSKGIEHVKVVILTADPTPDSPLTQNQVQAVCLHEIGHALGLIGHSPKPNDVMFCSMPSADTKVALSPRDVGTIRHLYANDVQIALSPKVKKGGDSTDKNSINNEGVELMSTHAYAQAIEKFEAALKLDPNYDVAKENLSRAYNNYAVELSGKGNEQEAETLLQKAMKMQNSIKNAAVKLTTLHNYANILRKLRRNNEAEKLEAEAKSIDPKQAN